MNVDAKVLNIRKSNRSIYRMKELITKFVNPRNMNSLSIKLSLQFSKLIGWG